MSATAPSVSGPPGSTVCLQINWFFWLLVPIFKTRSLSAAYRGAFHLHAGDVSRETPLEQDVGVRRLVITVQLPAHEVFSESLRPCGTGRSCITGSFTGISSWKVQIKWHRRGEFKTRHCCWLWRFSLIQWFSERILLYTLTWHSEGQAIVKTTGFGGDEEITKDTYGDEEGKEDHGCNGQTNQSADTERRGDQIWKDK